MQALSETKQFKLTAKQEEALDLFSEDQTNTLLFGGSRSTKTFTIVRTIITRALAVPKSRHAIVRFRFNHVKASIIYDTFPKVMELCFPEVHYKLDKSDWFIKFSNESEIWFGGLDDKERTEKILGNEYASILLNEISQISYSSFLMMQTRLAQKCVYKSGSSIKELRLKFYLDENPPTKGHWSYKLFIRGIEPNTGKPIENPEDYRFMQMNPYDNLENLPASYIRTLHNLPARQKKRFLDGQFGEETENALWSVEVIEANKVKELPELLRIIIPVDPSGASDDENKNNDDIGIGVIGLGVDGIAYVMEDLTVKCGPKKWGGVVANAYERHDADRVIGEQNFGGAMVEFVVRAANPNISYKSVTASRGKTVRAEPVSALHELGKVKFVGDFKELEDELLGFTTTGYIGERSPNRADWFVWGVTELFPKIAKKEKPKRAPYIPNKVTAFSR